MINAKNNLKEMLHKYNRCCTWAASKMITACVGYLLQPTCSHFYNNLFF
jgi:hypothetical protein